MPSKSPAIIAVLSVSALAVAAVGAFVFLAPRSDLPKPTDSAVVDAPTYAAPAELPPLSAERLPGQIATRPDASWLAATSESTGIPLRALAAYAGAAWTKNEEMPSCGLSWNTLAAIGWVESRHGTHNGSSIGANGTVTPPIYGDVLDGGTTANIPDSDGGTFDGLDDIDRAVGPMQFIPQAAKNWLGDANADGIADAQNIDDAAMAAAHYLCRAGGDLVSEVGWRTAIAAYNSAPSYLPKVAAKAVEYGDAVAAN
ncbi:MAG: lytic transglycosylase domain-containing protein [Microbacteriaceae bacterium]